MVQVANHTNRLASVQANGRACIEGVVRHRYQLASACKVVVECI